MATKMKSKILDKLIKSRGVKNRIHGKSIKINIYGCSAAGKTFFLGELISQLSQLDKKNKEKNSGGKKVRLNKKAKKFLVKHETRKKEERNNPTTKSIEGISISIRNDFFTEGNTGKRLVQDWPGNDWIVFVFHDVRGEEIRKTVDDSLANKESKKEVRRFLKDCQCLLFFFDPTYSDAAETDSNIEAFYAGETNQASILFEHVFECRPKNPLPCLFIQTHRDILDKKDDLLKQRANTWFDKVFDLQDKEYKGQTPGKGYKDIHPEILDRKKNQFRINSLNPGEVFGPLKRLCEIKRQVNPRVIRDWSPNHWLIITAALMLLVVGVIVFHVIPSHDKEYDRKAVIAQAKEKADSVRELTDRIKSIPTLRKPNETEVSNARKIISNAFHTLDPDNTKNLPDDEYRSALEELWKEFGQLIHRALRKVDGARSDIGDFDKRIETGRYFTRLNIDDAEFLPESERLLLKNNREVTWQAVQEFTSLSLKENIGAIRKEKLEPAVALEKLKAGLETQQDRWRALNSDISAPDEVQDRLKKDIGAICVFCADRLKHRMYEVVEHGVSGTVTADGKYYIEFDGQCTKSGETVDDDYGREITVSGKKVISPKESISYFLPLNSSVSMLIQTSSGKSEFEKVYGGAVASSPSLDFLGMPLIQSDGGKALVSANNARVDLTFEFDHGYHLPELFWSALK